MATSLETDPVTDPITDPISSKFSGEFPVNSREDLIFHEAEHGHNSW